MDVLNSISDLIFNTLKAAKERAKSPIFGTFALAWLLINWRLVYFFFFSDYEVTQKIQYIDANYIGWCSNLLYPALITVGYIALYPIIFNIANITWISADKLGRYLSNYVLEKKIPLTQEESAQLYALMRSKEQEYQKELSEKQETIDSLYAGLSESGQVPKKKDGEVSVGPDTSLGKDLSNPETFIGEYMDTFTNTDKSFYLKDLIARTMELDKDDIIHRQELLSCYEIIHQLFQNYPEPWTAKEIIIKDGENGSQKRLSVQHTEAYAKKLSSKGWVNLSVKNKKMVLKVTDELKLAIAKLGSNYK